MYKIIAHRGIFDNETIIENTKEAFQISINNKIPFELDIQLTKDNKLIVFHDSNTMRLTDQNIEVQEVTYDKLKDLNLLSTDSKIPLLKDILELNNDQVLIDIEIKKSKRYKETIDILLEELKPYMNYVIKSFDPRIVRYIHKNYSWIKCGLLVERKNVSHIKDYFLKSKLILNYCKPDFIAISKHVLKNKKYMNKIKNIPLFIWTINDIKDIDKNSNYTYICNNLLDK